jgi:hypothetical protein
MHIVQYILFLLLGLVTLLNLYYFTIGRKRKRAVDASVQQTMHTLDRRTAELAKQKKLSFDVKQNYLNDRSQGVVLAIDSTQRIIAIILETETHLLTCDEVRKAQQTYQTLPGGKITNLCVEVETPDAVISITFASRTYRPTSYLGKFLLEESAEFAATIEGSI